MHAWPDYAALILRPDPDGYPTSSELRGYLEYGIVAARGRAPLRVADDRVQPATPLPRGRDRAPPELEAGFAFDFDQSHTWDRTEPRPDPGCHFDQTLN